MLVTTILVAIFGNNLSYTMESGSFLSVVTKEAYEEAHLPQV